jgi:hypothetical protein
MTELLSEAQTATAAAQAARVEGLPDVVRAVRAVEKALCEALDGEPLRALKNIGNAGVTLYGARVRTDADTKIPHWNDRGSAVEYLCLDARGQLVTVYWIEMEGEDSGESEWELQSKSMPDEYIRVDDIHALTATLVEILPRHVKSARKNGGRYRALQSLAIRVRDVLNEGGD